MEIRHASGECFDNGLSIWFREKFIFGNFVEKLATSADIHNNVVAFVALVGLVHSEDVWMVELT